MSQPPESELSRVELRHAREAERHARTRHNAIVAGIVAVALLLAGIGVWIFAGRPDASSPTGPSPSPSPSASDQRQETLLLQFRDDNELAVDNALLGAGGDPQRSVFLFASPALLVDVAGAGTITLAEAARLPDTLASVNAVSDLLGVRVDGGLTLDRLAVAGLVDAVGGVSVDATVPVTRLNPDGSTTVVVPAGRSTLDGVAAAYYVTAALPGEPDAARTSRFSQVLQAVIRQLPDDSVRLGQVLTSLGSSARTTVPTEDAADFLLQLKAGVMADRVDYQTLPVTPLEAGGPVQTYRLNFAAASSMITKLLPEAVRVPGENAKVRVLVQNGVGTPGLGSTARDRLVEADFTYVNGGNAAQFGRVETWVIIPTAAARDRARGAAVARALQVPASAVRVSNQGQTIADVIVVLGADFVAATPPA